MRKSFLVETRRIELLSKAPFMNISPGAVNSWSIPLLRSQLTGSAVR